MSVYKLGAAVAAVALGAAVVTALAGAGPEVVVDAAPEVMLPFIEKRGCFHGVQFT